MLFSGLQITSLRLALTFEPAPRDSESAEPQKNELLLLQAATKFLED
jgi:hypothetical protein